MLGHVTGPTDLITPQKMLRFFIRVVFLFRNYDVIDVINVDGRNPAIQLRLIVYPMSYQVLCHIPGGCLGFLNHQQ